MNTTSKKPHMSAWERLNAPLNDKRSSAYSFSIRHMPSLLRKLQAHYPAKDTPWTGDISVDQAHLIQHYIQRNYNPEQVNWAHEACVRDYQQNNQRQGYKLRINFQSGRVESEMDMEDALGLSETEVDRNWLESIKDESHNLKEPETAMVAALQKAAEAKDNAEFATKGYVDANFATKLNLGDAMHKQQKFIADGIERLKSGISQDITTLTNAVVTLDNYVAKEIEALKNSKPTVIELKKPELQETIKLGVQHRNFPILLAMAQARDNIWVYGPAGTGKSTAGEQLALALFNDKSKFFTNGKMENQFEVLGYRNAAGVYQTTQFREAYEHGGVYMADEIDGSMPSAVLALNGALANGHCPFPDKTVARHPDFIFIGAANTTGMGGTIEYVGRMKHDAAFLDRFVTLDWPLDEGLEDAIVPNKKWLAYVRATRARLEKNPIKGHLITPRASIKGSNLLAYGVSPANVIKATLQKGLSDTQWHQIEPQYLEKAFN